MSKAYEEFKQRVIESLVPTVDKRVPKPVRIQHKGQFVELRSGKSLWRKMGDAKSAFRNHVSSLLYYSQYRDIFYKERQEWEDRVMKELSEEGSVQFVEMEAG